MTNEIQYIPDSLFPTDNDFEVPTLRLDMAATTCENSGEFVSQAAGIICGCIGLLSNSYDAGKRRPPVKKPHSNYFK